MDLKLGEEAQKAAKRRFIGIIEKQLMSASMKALAWTMENIFGKDEVKRLMSKIGLASDGDAHTRVLSAAVVKEMSRVFAEDSGKLLDGESGKALVKEVGKKVAAELRTQMIQVSGARIVGQEKKLGRTNKLDARIDKLKEVAAARTEHLVVTPSVLPRDLDRAFPTPPRSALSEGFADPSTFGIPSTLFGSPSSTRSSCRVPADELFPLQTAGKHAIRPDHKMRSKHKKTKAPLKELRDNHDRICGMCNKEFVSKNQLHGHIIEDHPKNEKGWRTGIKRSSPPSGPRVFVSKKKRRFTEIGKGEKPPRKKGGSDV